MTTQAETIQQDIDRGAAFMAALHAAKIGSSVRDPIERLRESYAMGRISLGAFEAQVEVLLRRAA